MVLDDGMPTAGFIWIICAGSKGGDGKGTARCISIVFCAALMSGGMLTLYTSL